MTAAPHRVASRVTAPEPVVASRAIRHLLVGPASDAEVVAVFPVAVHMAVAGDLVAVVAPGGVPLPNALLLSSDAGRRPLAGVRIGQRGVAGDGGLRVGSLHLRPARWWEPRPRLRPVTVAALRRAASAAAAPLHDGPPPAEDPDPDRLHRVGAALAAGDPQEAAAVADGLIGLGPGLTPTGDDLLCGLVAGLVLLGPAAQPAGRGAALATAAGTLGDALAAQAPGRTTRVSAALLSHAARGEVALPVATFLRALTGREDILTATDVLLAVGSTSGRDLAVGLLTAAHLVTGGAQARDAAAVPPVVAAAPAAAVVAHDDRTR